MSTITSFQNPRFKRVRKLHEGRHRRKLGLFLIEGVRPLVLAYRARVRLAEVFVCRDHPLSPQARELLLELDRRGVPLWEVAPRVFQEMLLGQRNEGVVAVAHTPRRALETLRLPPQPVVAVLDQVEKPGNIGAVFRSADASGVAAVLLSDPGTDLFNPHAIHASLGAVFTVPCAVGTAPEVKAFLEAHHLPCYAAQVGASQLYTQVDWTQGGAIVLGNEARGLGPLWRQDTQPVALPMLGQVDSLNVSVAAGVFFYEAWRQRHQGLGEPKSASES